MRINRVTTIIPDSEDTVGDLMAALNRAGNGKIEFVVKPPQFDDLQYAADRVIIQVTETL